MNYSFNVVNNIVIEVIVADDVEIKQPSESLSRSFTMEPSFKSLAFDDDRYQRSFKLFLERSSEHQCMQDFIKNQLPDILAR